MNIMSFEILSKRQNDSTALKLILVQRRLNMRAKGWGLLRFIGVVVLGVVTPVVTFYNAKASVLITAVAILWLVLARVWFVRMELLNKSKAALVQNEFDAYVFGIQNPTEYSDSIRLEERADILPHDANVTKEATRYKLTDWYPFEPNASDSLNIAIAQRTNGTYSARLLKRTSTGILVATILWIAGIVIYGSISKLSGFDLMAGIIIPVLPGALDNFEHWLRVRDAYKQRLSLADEIEDHIRRKELPEQAHVHWQQITYELRREAPYVPNLLYKLTRSRNERAMKAASKELVRIWNNG